MNDDPTRNSGPETPQPEPVGALPPGHEPLLLPPANTPSASGSRRVSRRWLWLLLPLFLIAAAVYAYKVAKPPAANESAKGKGKKGGDAGTPVIAARARKGNIGVYLNGLGAVTPIYTVTLRSRVDGELMNIRYKEGDLVQKGDLLIEIDPRPFEVQLTQAEGQMAKDQATLANARIDLARYETLLKQNAIPEQQVATQRATVLQDEGIVKSDQGLIDSVKLNLIYCKITAPITGRVGLRLVDPGNIVHASDSTGLLVITQIQPISVIFTVAEDQLNGILRKKRAGQKLQVDIYDREMQKKIAQGTLETIDNEIDQTTGTVRLRAVSDNKDQGLFPNQFVNVRMLLEEKKGVVLVPGAAIQRTTNSTFVYLVKPDSTVTVRDVKIGTMEGDDSEITEGLQEGDVAVMAGADKLQEGSKVTAQIPGESQPASGARSAPGGKTDAGGKGRGKQKQ